MKYFMLDNCNCTCADDTIGLALSNVFVSPCGSHHM